MRNVRFLRGFPHSAPRSFKSKPKDYKSKDRQSAMKSRQAGPRTVTIAPGHCSVFITRIGFSFWAALSVLAAPATSHGKQPGRLSSLGPGDTIAFVGGTDTVQAEKYGYLELALLAAGDRTATPPKMRTLAWQADTDFDRDRPLNFGDLAEHLRDLKATVVVAAYGKAEILSGQAKKPEQFIAAYDRLLASFGKIPSVKSLILMTPPPFENAGGTLPDLSHHNATVSALIPGLKALAKKRGYLFVDVFSDLQTRASASPRTSDGFSLTDHGHAEVAAAFARQVGIAVSPWASLDAARQAIVDKNQLWHNYHRPTNWSFLKGDRISVASSYDHLDPKKRWFPDEMKLYLPLIEAADQRVARAALTMGGKVQ